MTLNPEDQYHQDISQQEQEEQVYMPIRNIPQQSISKTAKTSTNMPVTKCKVLLKQSSQLNNQIINYFKQNLLALNNNRFIFEWIAVYEEEIEYYEEQGIDRFPVLIITDNSNVTGVSKILKTLDQIINSSAANTPSKTQVKSKSQSIKESGEDMHDFLLAELKSPDKSNDDDEEGDNVSSTMAQRVNTMNKARKDNGLHSMDNKSSSGYKSNDSDSGSSSDSDNGKSIFITAPKQLSTTELIKKTTKNTEDDKMMSKYWENQEETEM